MIVKYKEYDIGNNKRIVAYYDEKENTEISKEAFEDVVIPALQIRNRLEQAEGEKHEIRADMDKETKAYVMGYNQALADIRGDNNG